MARPYPIASGVFASLVLSCLTLSVFAKSQLVGPEGTLNRYLMAVGTRNWDQAARLCFGYEEDFVAVTNHFAKILFQGGRYEIVDVVRAGPTARAGLLFYVPGYGEIPLIVSLRRVEKSWSIDLDRTRRPYRQLKPADLS
jgi:hypothetical protein